MADVAPSWVCLLVNHNFLRRRGSSVEQEMRNAFGEDFLDFAMTYDGSEETYAFVKCVDYHSHVSRLRYSPAIKSVLSTFDSPCFLSDDEVKEFVISATPAVTVREFQPGDVVRVCSGFLSNLVGIVVKSAGGSRYHVAFRFHIRRFRERLSAKDLTLVSNVFKLVRSPVIRPPGSRGRPAAASCRQEKSSHELGSHRTSYRKRGKKRGG